MYLAVAAAGLGAYAAQSAYTRYVNAALPTAENDNNDPQAESTSVSPLSEPDSDAKLKQMLGVTEPTPYCKWDTLSMNKKQLKRYTDSIGCVFEVCRNANVIQATHPDIVSKVFAEPAHVAFKVSAIMLGTSHVNVQETFCAEYRLESLRSALCVYMHKDVNELGFDAVAKQAEVYYKKIKLVN